MAVKPVPDARPEDPEPVFGPDIELIRALAAVLDEAGLTEIEIGEGANRIRIAREAAPVAAPVPVAAAAPVAAVPVAQEEPAALPAVEDDPGAVTSPLVGVVYVAPEPGGRPFVVAGDEINEGDTLFIVEAMKTMNPVRAPRGGRVTRILAENGARVEYGEVLLILE
ncbi:MAG: acetyl-CoA carboxylase biotin carboxyl carrier protein subunit [Rhodospirillales bacterium]|nr:acetyl-CoA carboxylase biotin carboxyl carrier protein subunit [Rhodospirillales bacterium]MDE0378010.1 acetyl-CoA carboxylase biotin carboxyl carrier protein subunit [Rhodospirillales bacterium]MDE0391921.1 acetyl-CoA carboxylase biotin carboxyl carrier protein subunit [Rhodospirillales bacterium]